MNRLLTLATLLAVAITAACAGEDGQNGATGPQGPPGTANVISGRDTVTNADWSTTTVQGSFNITPGGTSFSKPARFLDINVPAITAPVLSAGAVLVWMQSHPGGTQVDTTKYVQLPWIFTFVLGSHHIYEREVTLGRIRVLYFIVDLSNPGTTVDPLAVTQATRIFRWVIIPPAASALVAALPADAGPDATLAALEAGGYRIVNKAGLSNP
jgi:hypothetical protein